MVISIDTKVLYKGRLFKTDYMISLSLFRIKDAYRPFETYLNYTKKTIHYLDKILPEASVRIYIDSSVKDDEIKQLINEKIQIVHFYCETFWKSNVHEGLFGTFARFIPLFDSKHKGCVIITDVDIEKHHIQFLRKLVLNSPDDMDIGFINNTCKNGWMPSEHKFGIVCFGIVSSLRFPKRILSTFLKFIEEGNIRTNWKNWRMDGSFGRIPYPTDEIFFNTIFYEYLEKIHAKVYTITRSTPIVGLKSIYSKIPPEFKNQIKHMITEELNTYDAMYWNEPFNPELKKLRSKLIPILSNPIFKSYFDQSHHKECIEDFMKHGKIIQTKTIQL